MGKRLVVSVLVGVLAVGPASMSHAQEAAISPDAESIDWKQAIEDATEAVVAGNLETSKLQTEEETAERRRTGLVLFASGLGVAALGGILAVEGLKQQDNPYTSSEETGQGAAVMGGLLIGGGIYVALAGWKRWKRAEASG